jgi:hypothetical protein
MSEHSLQKTLEETDWDFQMPVSQRELIETGVSHGIEAARGDDFDDPEQALRSATYVPSRDLNILLMAKWSPILKIYKAAFRAAWNEVSQPQDS